MTPAERLAESFRLTELRRAEMLDEIAAEHPDWTAREVELGRNRRWLRQAYEGEVFNAHSRLFYGMLVMSEGVDEAACDSAANAVRELSGIEHDARFLSAVEQLGLTEEWRSVLARLGMA
ncbi:MAG: hypothetical protein ACRCT8_15360 [Lacipirellulaceae bacterium]